MYFFVLLVVRVYLRSVAMLVCGNINVFCFVRFFFLYFHLLCSLLVHIVQLHICTRIQWWCGLGRCRRRRRRIIRIMNVCFPISLNTYKMFMRTGALPLDNQTKWRKCNFISIQFEIRPFFRTVSFFYIYCSETTALFAIQIKTIKIKSIFYFIRSFSLSLSLFSGHCFSCPAALAHSPFRMWIVNNVSDFIQRELK